MKQSEMNKVNMNLRINAACKKIRHQFPGSTEGRLMYSIIALAISDAASSNGINARQAKTFLSNEMPQAELCGVNSNWITDVLVKMNLLDNKTNLKYG